MIACFGGGGVGFEKVKAKVPPVVDSPAKTTAQVGTATTPHRASAPRHPLGPNQLSATHGLNHSTSSIATVQRAAPATKSPPLRPIGPGGQIPLAPKPQPTVASPLSSRPAGSRSVTPGGVPSAASLASAPEKAPVTAVPAPDRPTPALLASVAQEAPSIAPESEPLAARPVGPGPVVAAVRDRAAHQRRHVHPAAALTKQAQLAAVDPKVEARKESAAESVETMDKADPGVVQREEFRMALHAAIEEATTPVPTTEGAADTMMATGARVASQAVRHELPNQTAFAAGPLRDAATSNAPVAAAGSAPELLLEKTGRPPESVDGSPAVPPALPAAQLDFTENSRPTGELMAQHGVTAEQLAEGNEPAFASAVDSRRTAEQHTATAESRYRPGENDVRSAAGQRVDGQLAGALDAMRSTSVTQFSAVADRQGSTKAGDEAERNRVTGEIDAIKVATQTDVKKILADMEAEVATKFGAGLARAEKAYAHVFEKEKGGLGSRIWNELKGSWDEHIAESLATARVAYLAEVIVAIDEVADCVEVKLAAAKKRAADGRTAVARYVADLQPTLRTFGEEAERSIAGSFDELESGINARRDAVIGQVVGQFRESQQRIAKLADKLREENKSLWAMVKDATVGAINAIIEFKNLLMKVLARVAGVVGEIIAHPIRFLEHLVAAVGKGIQGFRDNIAKHLKEGFVAWVFGAVADAGITLPKTFDLKSIFGLIMEVLGLTWKGIRKLAVEEVGEPLVRTLETVSEPVLLLISDGPGALWEWIKEKVSDLKQAFIEEVESWVVTSVVKAGITWLMSLLTPASAFIKACKAIYDIIMFFVERGKQILDLVSAVIESVADIAAGSIQSAATRVEDALAKTIPVAIGFLASLLGLGDIGGTIRRFITKIREPVTVAAKWVIHKMVNLARSAGKLLGFGKKEPKPGTPEHDAKVTAGLYALQAAIKKMPSDVTLEQANTVAQAVHSDHRIFSKLEAVDGGDSWDFLWAASDGDKQKGRPKARVEALIRDDSQGAASARRGLWQITEAGSEATRTGPFGKVHKSRSDGLWWSRERWSRDTYGHGGSVWKVFCETPKGLKHKADADEFGDFIVGKHKGPTGEFIPWSRIGK